jgi:uncharacterized membrane protein
MAFSLLNLLSFPITLPYKGFMSVAETIKKEIDKELLNKDNIKDKILKLEYLFETGEITEEEYTESHEYLIKYYRKIQEEQLEENS